MPEPRRDALLHDTRGGSRLGFLANGQLAALARPDWLASAARPHGRPPACLALPAHQAQRQAGQLDRILSRCPGHKEQGKEAMSGKAFCQGGMPLAFLKQTARSLAGAGSETGLRAGGLAGATPHGSATQSAPTNGSPGLGKVSGSSRAHASLAARRRRASDCSMRINGSRGGCSAPLVIVCGLHARCLLFVGRPVCRYQSL